MVLVVAREQKPLRDFLRFTVVGQPMTLSTGRCYSIAPISDRTALKSLSFLSSCIITSAPDAVWRP